MEKKNLLVFLLLLLALVTYGCAGTSSFPSGAQGSPMNDCNGDLPSPYPPYCRPVHN